MQFISNADILDMLLFVEERINTTIERCSSVISVNDFLASPDKMDIFDATCMRLQTIGETIKNIDNLTNHKLLINYAGTPWRSIIGLRNIISHEYLSIDPEEIFKIVKVHLPKLLLAIQLIRNDIAANI
ncbi:MULTISPECIES: HepT-like ribonuclease domain-containing protein [Bacteroides]|jgi:uncharacterized protein with HEPN domain|uniref:HepT-like ribonuclease domain-containing protein n=1 Tax=Bacteroides TaxID=816 RepID=UPI000820B4DE|nr:MULTISPECIES: HepT-like ribonuclease domain-containing protein [Bacteroides]SCI07622.1 Uncharacterized conserved protein [uncultured Bacteroides sp.]